MAKIIGIDLGTTNSCVSVMEGNEPVVITNDEGKRTTPSIIGFLDNGERKVGDPAKRQAITNPLRTIMSIKRFMGRRYSECKDEASLVPYKIEQGPNDTVRVNIDGRQYTPQEISAITLQKMKKIAEDYLGHEVNEAVITVPAYFNDSQRQATIEAGVIAGLKVSRIINEPTAAALAYGMDKKDQNIRVAVYDLGGGTFDISILELGDGIFEVKSTHGDTHLGGDDFDRAIMEWLMNEFKTQEGIDLKDNAEAIQRLKEAAEKAKIELSSGATADINLPYISFGPSGAKHLVRQLTRAKFEQITESLVKRTLEPCRKALEDAGYSTNDIDEVILVGGSTRIPRIQQVVEEFFKRKPNRSVNPDEVVAIGAAIQGGVLTGEVKDVLLLDVTPLSLGIETMGGVMTRLIESNTTIPKKASQVFSTAADNQTSVDINILQGERPMANQNRSVGRFNLDGIPAMRRGEPQIEVTFNIDANGVLSVSAKEMKTGKEQSIRIEASTGLSQEEIDRMKKEAEANAESDRKARQTADKINEADGLIFQTEKQLAEYGDKIPTEGKASIEAAVTELKAAHQAQDLEQIEASISKLNDAWAAVTGGMGADPNAGAGQAQQPNNDNNNQAGGDDYVDFEEVKK